MKIQLKDFLHKNKNTLLTSNQLPLLNNTYMDELGADLVQQPNGETTESVLSKLGDYPKFKNITSNDIIHLRLLLHLKSSEEKMETWCMKILRYIEIQYSKLKRKEISYGRSKEEQVQIFNQVMALFVEYHLQKNDLLYLNTALKIADLNWIVPTSQTAMPLKALHYLKISQLEAILQRIENG